MPPSQHSPGSTRTAVSPTAAHADSAAGRCPLCATAGGAYFHAANGYNLVQCPQCSLIYVSPMPSDAEIEAHYQRAEYFAGSDGQGYEDYSAMKKALIPHFRRRLDTLAAHLPTSGRLLDFGCAAGYFLEMAQRDGWQVTGVELSADMAQAAATTLGVPIANNLDGIPLASVSALTLWEVIEHLPRPLDTLAQFHAILTPGGALMLSTPNTAHWLAQEKSSLWKSFRPPAHLLYFTPTTLELALRTAGFVDVTIRQVNPLPRLPAWLDRLTRGLQESLANGSARPWLPALLLWRAIRVGAWGWQKLRRPKENPFATLEALAFRPRP
jgi:SAM-dependent methyltransferase